LVRRARRQAEGRVRQGIGKKLAAAFRYDLERKGRDSWLAKLADEFPNEVKREALPVRPKEAREEPWHEFYWQAWQALRSDRHYGVMGGQMPMSFMALDAYARRYGIDGEAFDRFHVFMSAIDAEWLAYVGKEEST
jgi:hypothetical protein